MTLSTNKGLADKCELIIDQAGDAFYILDFSGRILDVNHHATESVGYSKSELLKMYIFDLDIEVAAKKHKMRYWEPLQQLQYTTFEGLHKRKDGSTFPVEVRLGRLDLGDEKMLLALARDITERKKVEQELKKHLAEIESLTERLKDENILLKKDAMLLHGHDQIIGKSPIMLEVLKAVKQVAPTEATVLILGETGTGKELMAHLIHDLSPRKSQILVRVNCAALPTTLIESELFGREKGAYTGADSKQIGRFELADNATIFLDEIGELPLEVQGKLLRVLQEGEFERIGSNKTIRVNVRVIAATNKNLSEEVKKGTFRDDLYYRLNVFPISSPPLRERPEDIPLLAWSFVKELSGKTKKIIKDIPKADMTTLQGYSWPGNVRELRNVIERAMIWANGTTLRIELPEAEELSTTGSQEMSLQEAERQCILRALKKTDWCVSGEAGAANLLDINPKTLASRMKKLGIELPRTRKRE